MSSTTSNLSSLARSKLQLSNSSKDSYNLHRWVLLKNSILRSLPLLPSASAPSNSHLHAQHSHALEDSENDDSGGEEADSFMFPDVGVFVDGLSSDSNNAETQWLNSLLESLGDDEEDDFGAESDASVLPGDDDDNDSLLSPLPSPISSTDDLPNQTFYPLPTIVPYTVPYPPYHPPLISYHADSSFDSSFNSALKPLSLTPYDDPLPYYHIADDDDDDVENMSVPDAIEDTSDDESDPPASPSLGRSNSSIALDPASIPLPEERSSGLRHPFPAPHVYVDSDVSYFYPFEVDQEALPTLDGHFSDYQEC